ncbi:unnamed protein product [Durusdinium trenchii]|uniref:Uncharacterized protein n=1 Tax=Durusdinium trenchii TaxID=1381693 RepID=A0ABP0JEZ2_9DINO
MNAPAELNRRESDHKGSLDTAQTVRNAHFWWLKRPQLAQVVTLSSLQAAFPHMKPVQARYLMRTLFEEDKRQKATQRVLTGEDSLMGAPGPSQDLDPKEIATACVPLFMAATQPVMSEFMTKLAALEAKVNALESEGLLDAVATSAQANFAKDMLEGIHVQPTTLMGRLAAA